VLGREFYVMERLGGTVYERSIPEEVVRDPQRVRRMSESVIEQIAAIHSVDLHATGLDAVGDGRHYLDGELEHWVSEIRRVQHGPLPALERLVTALRDRQPEQCPTITLVHGDPKTGNFAFEIDQVSAVFDWEMASPGDPLADVGWAELQWTMPASFTSLPSSLSPDQFIARYEALTGITVRHREWYRAFQGFKMAVIVLVAAMLFDDGYTDDLRFADMANYVHPLTQQALRELGIGDEIEPGPVAPRRERVFSVRQRTAGDR
jgi:aminoglycoside phosphotransferase (APT) family kinase protein